MLHFQNSRLFFTRGKKCTEKRHFSLTRFAESFFRRKWVSKAVIHFNWLIVLKHVHIMQTHKTLPTGASDIMNQTAKWTGRSPIRLRVTAIAGKEKKKLWACSQCVTTPAGESGAPPESWVTYFNPPSSARQGSAQETEHWLWNKSICRIMLS